MLLIGTVVVADQTIALTLVKVALNFVTFSAKLKVHDHVFLPYKWLFRLNNHTVISFVFQPANTVLFLQVFAQISDFNHLIKVKLDRQEVVHR